MFAYVCMIHIKFYQVLSLCQFSSVAHSCLTLCDPMNCNTPGLPVHHQLLEFTQTHVRPFKILFALFNLIYQKKKKNTHTHTKESYVSPGGSLVKNLPLIKETQVWFLGREDPLEEGMATHSTLLAWKIPWTEEPGELQSMGLQRVGQH